MEAVREQQTSSGSQEVRELPPAPTAFPVELLHELQREAIGEDISPLKDLDLDTVRKSCLSALSLVLQTVEGSPTPSKDGPPQWQSESDRQLANALKELLDVCRDLRSFSVSESSSATSPADYQALAQQLSSVQSSLGAINLCGISEEPTESSILSPNLHPTVLKVRERLNWSRLETLCGIVTKMCNDRVYLAREMGNGEVDEPPGYRQSFDSDAIGHHPRRRSESLPSYADRRSQSGDGKGVKEKDRSSDVQHEPLSSEKMLLELDAVTTAIDRLYSVAPQLANQRAILRPKNGKQSDYSVAEEQAKERELMEIWERIERAHGSVANSFQKVRLQEVAPRSLNERKQTFVSGLMDHAETGRLHSQDSELISTEIAKAKELKRRDMFLRDLLEQSGHGRMHTQDATAPTKRTEAEACERDDRSRESLLGDIVAASTNGRLETQEHSLSPEDTLAKRKEVLITTLADYSNKGRLDWQDSAPSTPLRASTPAFEGNEDVNATPKVKKGTSAYGMDDGSSDANLHRSRSSSSITKSLGIRKVASFVRRSSVSKNTLLAPDLQNLSYVAEHQENLQVVQVLLSMPQTVDWSSFTAETDVSGMTGPMGEAMVVLKSSAGAQSACLDLPTPVTAWQRIALRDLPSPTEFKLRAERSAAPPTPALNMVITHALSAPELRKMQPTALACLACDRELADLTTVSSTGQWERGAGFKDLPSEHWAEMLEAWMCHADAGFTNQLTERTKDGFWPVQGTVLVGGSYMLVDASDTCQKNLQIDGKVSPDMWRTVSCACGEVVGRQKSKDNSRSNSTIRFAKHSVAVLRLGEDGEEVQSLRFPLSVFIVSDMLELAQAHASYRFSITREDDDEDKTLIWLFNPSIGISYRKASNASASPATPTRNSFSSNGLIPTRSRRSSVASSLSARYPAETKTMKAVKVLYQVVTREELDNGAYTNDSIMAGFQTGQSTEHLIYPKAVCDELESVLRQSTSVYPVARRSMGAFSIGFLERV